MTIHLPSDLEGRLQAAVVSGRFASVDDAVAEAARRLLKDLEQGQPGANPVAPARKNRAARKAKPSQQEEKPASRQAMTEADFLNHLLKIGLITQLPDPAQDIDDDDPDDAPIVIKGEPLSETIIRERR